MRFLFVIVFFLSLFLNLNYNEMMKRFCLYLFLFIE